MTSVSKAIELAQESSDPDDPMIGFEAISTLARFAVNCDSKFLRQHDLSAIAAFCHDWLCYLGQERNWETLEVLSRVRYSQGHNLLNQDIPLDKKYARLLDYFGVLCNAYASGSSLHLISALQKFALAALTWLQYELDHPDTESAEHIDALFE